MPLRLYLTGRLELEHGDVTVPASQLHGPQGRRALARLGLAAGQPVARDELAQSIWDDALAPSWDSALSAIVSKLRRVLVPVGAEIGNEYGAYSLLLPAGAWIDLEAAAAAIDDAEAALRRNCPAEAFGPAAIARAVGSRSFLTGEEGAWIETVRSRLHSIHVRSVDALYLVWQASGDAAQVLEAARAAVELEPYRDSSHLRLMRAHVEVGDRAQALRAYEQYRRLVADELGADPAPEVESYYLQLLGQPA